MDIHESIKNLDFPLTLEDDFVVENAIVLMRVMNMETGDRSFAISTSEGTDVIVAAGLIAVALDITTENGWSNIDDEDDTH